MIDLVTRLFARAEPAVSEAGPRDAGALAAIHEQSFRRGWSEDEFDRLLLDRDVLAHRLIIGRDIVGFMLSRIVEGEAEILSVAIAPARRGRGLARMLLDVHLRRLAGFGVTAVFLEVEAENVPACRLYAAAGFREVGRRPGYYPRPPAEPALALVLRRDL